MIDSKTVDIHVNGESKFDIPFQVSPYIKKVLEKVDIKRGFFEFSFIDEKEIVDINQKYLDRTYETDIISFNLGTLDNIIGDVYIAIPVAKKNALEFNQSFEQELKRLLVHGILHLLDYRDYTDEEKEEMHSEQERLLKSIDDND